MMSSDSDAALPQPAPAPSLTPKDLRALRARAHALKPVVWIASTGATEGVVRELDRALAAHELVKLHAAIDEREERSRLLASLCRTLSAQPVQIIGKMLVAFRPRPQRNEAQSPPATRGSPRKRTSNERAAKPTRPAAQSRVPKPAKSRRKQRPSR
jgi:putative YhbY family RNA-binding protein